MKGIMLHLSNGYGSVDIYAFGKNKEEAKDLLKKSWRIHINKIAETMLVDAEMFDAEYVVENYFGYVTYPFEVGTATMDCCYSVGEKVVKND